MERYFDAFLYLANWGTRELMIRLPETLLSLAAAEQYCTGEPGDAACAWAAGGNVIVSLRSDEEPADYWPGHEAADLVCEVGDSCSAEQLGEVLWRKVRQTCVSCLLTYDLQDGGRAQVELIEQEVIRVNDLQAERAERRFGEVPHV